MIRLGGMTPLTTIDFPGKLAAVLFVQGCPWRCSYCHNPELLPARAEGGLAWEDADDFLRRRRGLLDGVVFSGGEPTVQSGLYRAIAHVKRMGYRIGLHTGGMYPGRLRQVLPLLDWIGLDVKAPERFHSTVTGRKHGAVQARESLHLVLDSGIDYECRTTWHADVFPLPALYELADDLADCGVANWAVQACRETGRIPHPDDRPDPARLGARFSRFEFRG
mgnify:CR=1 FL=1